MAKRKPATAAPSIGDVLDRHQAAERSELIQSGRRKLAAGVKPTRDEERALRQYEKELIERYGPRYLADYPKGKFTQRIGRAPKVWIDLCRRLGISAWFASDRSIDRDELDAQLANVLIDNAAAILRAQRTARLRSTGDADQEEIDYDYWDARRVKAIAEEHEHKVRLLQASWAPVEVLEPLLRSIFTDDLRAMIDDYDRRPEPELQQAAERLRRVVLRIGGKISAALENATAAGRIEEEHGSQDE